MNLFSIPEKASEEFCQQLASFDCFRVERIVSQGHCSPDNFLNTGDMLFIPAHLKHRVEATGHTPPCVWLCIFGRFNQTMTQENRP